jgi:hypothetical protein
MGPYDYQELPTAPAVHVTWPKETDAACLDRLLIAARADGWAIHGAAFLSIPNPRWPTLDAMIVLARGTDAGRFHEFLQWLDEHPDVSIAAVPRNGDERYDSR